MNDREFDEQLQELFDEIDRLKAVNQKLSNELLALRASSNAPQSLGEIFTKKYLQIHDEVKQERLREIEKKISEYELYRRQLLDKTLNVDEALENDEYSVRNKVLEKEQADITTKVYDLRKKIDAVKEYYDSRLDELSTPILSRYKTIINDLKNGHDIRNDIDRFIGDIRSSYPISQESKKINGRKEEELASINAELLLALDQANAVSEKKEALIKDIEKDYNDNIAAMMANFNSTIELEKQLKEELNESFDKKRDKHVEEIVNQAAYYKQTDTSLAIASDRLDRLVNKLAEDIRSEDTFLLLKTNKKVRLNEVNLALERLENDHKKLERLKNRSNELYQIYISSSNAIDELVDFLDSATLAITESERYNEVSRRYLYLKELETSYESDYAKLKKEFSLLEHERQEKTMCAFPETEIAEITDKLAKINSETFKLTGKIEDVKYDIDKIEKSYENVELLSVLKEKAYVEKKIPGMYNNLRNLKLKISDLKREEQELESVLKDYDNLKAEKERLENEINY